MEFLSRILKPRSATAYLDKAEMLRRKGQIDKSIELYHAGIKSFRKDIRLYMELSKVYLEINAPQEAKQTLEKALKYSPDHPCANLILGQIYMDMKKFVIGRGFFDSVLQVDPQSADAYHGLALCRAGEQRFQDAVRLCDQAIKLQPQRAVYFLDMGVFLTQLKRYPEAISMFDRCLSFDNRNADCLVRLGAVYAEQGQFEKAQSLYQRSIQFAPRNPEGYYHLARLYHQEGKLQLAMDMYRQVLNLDPHDTEASRHLKELAS